MISFRSLTGLISMMEIIVKISAIQQLTFSRFRDLLTVPGAVATGRLSESAFRWAPGRYRSRYCTTVCANVAWFDLVDGQPAAKRTTIFQKIAHRNQSLNPLLTPACFSPKSSLRICAVLQVNRTAITIMISSAGAGAALSSSISSWAMSGPAHFKEHKDTNEETTDTRFSYLSRGRSRLVPLA